MKGMRATGLLGGVWAALPPNSEASSAARISSNVASSLPDAASASQHIPAPSRRASRHNAGVRFAITQSRINCSACGRAD